MSFGAAHKVKRLREHDVLPTGIGKDEATALIVKVLADEVPKQDIGGDTTSKSKSRNVITAAQKCGTFLAVVVRGVAAGIKSVGDGLVKFADCLSGVTTPSSRSGEGAGKSLQ